jgi:DNA (cytosine-5)-methyltransferase 1
MNNNKKFKFIDLFAGCGGLSEGFYMEGFNALVHLEIDPYACETLKARMDYYGYENAETAVLEQDITSEDVIDRINKVVNGEEVDVIIGGPPCQSFSPHGVARDENNPRNYLFESYVEILNYYKPKFFVFENVTGLLKTKINGESLFNIILEKLSEEYNVLREPEKMVLNATNYGVPQDRKRVIILGVRKDIDITPDEVYSGITKTHYDPSMKVNGKEDMEKYVTVRDAIGDLPSLKPGEGKKVIDHTFDVDKSNDFIKKVRKNNQTTITDHIARKHNEMDIKRYVEMSKNKWNFLELLEHRPDLGHEKRRVFFNSYKVQWWDKPSKTIIAHLYKDGNQFIHPDYTQGRTLTPREAARLQSFPDDFMFHGSKSQQYKQIGNAVPPLLAEAIAKSIKVKLLEIEGEKSGI